MTVKKKTVHMGLSMTKTLEVVLAMLDGQGINVKVRGKLVTISRHRVFGVCSPEGFFVCR